VQALEVSFLKSYSSLSLELSVSLRWQTITLEVWLSQSGTGKISINGEFSEPSGSWLSVDSRDIESRSARSGPWWSVLIGVLATQQLVVSVRVRARIVLSIT
jgi:hypothetical protein